MNVEFRGLNRECRRGGNRLWALGFGLLVCAVAQSAEYVLPGRADLGIYQFDNVSLPLGTWTNTAQWMVDGSRVDFSPDRADVPEVVGVNCLSSTGADTISCPAVLDGAVVLNGGTAVGTATAGVITFTAGTIYNVEIEDVLYWPCQSGSWPFDVSGNGNHATAATATLSTVDGVTSANATDGVTVNAQIIHDTEFVDPAAWVSKNNWIISAGSATHVGGGVDPLEQDILPQAVLRNGAIYRLTISFNAPGGLLYISNGGFGATSISMGTTQSAAVYEIPCLNKEKRFRLVPIAGWAGSITSIKLELLDVLVPALAGGSGLDVLGNPLTHPGGVVHNGAECSLVLADGSTNTYAQLLALPGTRTNEWGGITSLYLEGP